MGELNKWLYFDKQSTLEKTLPHAFVLNQTQTLIGAIATCWAAHVALDVFRSTKGARARFLRVGVVGVVVD